MMASSRDKSMAGDDPQQADISQMFQLVLDSIPSRVFWKDTEGRYQGCNQLFAEDAGKRYPQELIGKTDFDMGWTQAQARAFVEDDREVMSRGAPKLNIEEPQDQDGQTHWLETNKVPLTNPAGEVIGVLGTYTDVTERKRFEQAIKDMAEHDDLTGLPNRRVLRSRIEQCPDTEWAALLFVDLDQFKVINDSLGHAVGDRVLRAVAMRITSTAQEADTVCRLGGDEFGILLTNLGSDASEAGQRASALAQQLIDSFEVMLQVDGHGLYVGASIGITLMAAGSRLSQQQFREADLAMYEAKARGLNGFELYDKSMRDAADRRHALQNRLRETNCQEHMRLEYQPQVDERGLLLGCEALLRWQDPSLGRVAPIEFIPLAEQTGLMHRIGEWVIEQATAQLATWARDDLLSDGFRLAINVSAVQFARPEFVDRILAIVNQHAIRPSWLELEITEALQLDQDEQTLADLNRLAGAGFGVVVDDFGTGYSSLKYLSRMPINKIKIDPEFVSEISSNRRHARIAQTVLHMAQALDLDVVAEGVANRSDADFLKGMGYRIFQGALYDSALSADAFSDKWLSQAPTVG